jgi:CDP-glucose 4,6-dehydratase
MNPSFWKNRKVMLTGHTGFKGSWLSLWLQDLGGDVSGFSIDVPTDPSLYDSASVGDGMTSVRGDVRDLESLRSFMEKTAPEVVFHMAAQSLVRRSYDDPLGTYATNVMGTANLLEAMRTVGSARVAIIVTSDKCYDNREHLQAYAENEPMGGFDPYSSSKACAELVTAAYRNSFFNSADFDQHRTAIASVRAGNAIGGGDWAKDRLIPDIVAAFKDGTSPRVRNPYAIRPWQFVMDPLNGYLTLAECLWSDGPAFAGAWNFGPDESDAKEVGYVVDQLSQAFGHEPKWKPDESGQPHEARYLKLDSSKARSALPWSPVLDLTTTLDWIVEWYQRGVSAKQARAVTLDQIHRFQVQAAH